MKRADRSNLRRVLRELLHERFGPPPYSTLEDPPVLAQRRRALAAALPKDEDTKAKNEGAA